MFPIKINFLVWIMLIHKQECAVIRLDHNTRMKDGIEYVLQKYLSPLRKLTAELPNHAIEMQIEIHDSIPNATHNPQRRVIRVLKNKSVKRSQDATTTPSTEATTTAAPSTDPPTPGPESVAAGSDDTSKLPVYMDDLKKALDDLEKKLSSTKEKSQETSTMTTNGDQPCNGQHTQLNGQGSTLNIDDIVNLLKKDERVDTPEILKKKRRLRDFDLLKNATCRLNAMNLKPYVKNKMTKDLISAIKFFKNRLSPKNKRAFKKDFNTV